jgi:molybdate transport system substrate-binding protein
VLRIGDELTISAQRTRSVMKPPLATLAAVSLLVVPSCGSNASPSGGTSASAVGQTLTVFAAASLKGTFTELGTKFEASHPGTRVTFSFAGSSDLVAQLQGGAPADVFASADTKNMDKATGDKLVDGTPVNFASNTLEIAVPPDNPAGVTSLQDLTKSTVKAVVCEPAVPCGSAAQKVATAAKLTLKPVSEEQSVTDVLNKVETGEADAGLVYVTDVKSAGDKVKGITFPESKSAVNQYPIAALTASKNKELAKDFVTLVTGPGGQQVLSDAGFAKP